MSKGTDRRTVRIAPDIWDAARAVADERGETVSDVIRRALTDYTSSGGAGDDDAASTTNRRNARASATASTDP